MSTTEIDTGGALVGVEFSDRFKRLVEGHGVFQRNAFYMPMRSGELNFPKQVGEVQVFLLPENKEGGMSEPNYNIVRLQAKQMGTLTYYPRELQEDAAAVGEWVARSIIFAFARKLDQLGFNGDGGTESFGIQGLIFKLRSAAGNADNGGGLVQASGAAGARWSGITLRDFQAMMARLPNYESMAGPKWYCSRAFYYGVMVPLQFAAGGVTAAEVANGSERRFMGDPVELVTVMPSVAGNTQVPVLYGDLTLAATYGDRRQIQIDQSEHYRFAQRQIAVLGTHRAAISVDEVGTATTPGPIVGLLTPAAA